MPISLFIGALRTGQFWTSVGKPEVITSRIAALLVSAKLLFSARRNRWWVRLASSFLRCRRHAKISNFQKNYCGHTPPREAPGDPHRTPWVIGGRDSAAPVRRHAQYASGLDSHSRVALAGLACNCRARNARCS